MSKNLSQLIRSNTPHYWTYMKHRADLSSLKQYLPFEGILAGDPHMGNFTVLATLGVQIDRPDLPMHQLRRHRRQSIVLTLGPTVFVRLSFDVAGFARALAERAHKIRERVWRTAAQEPTLPRRRAT